MSSKRQKNASILTGIEENKIEKFYFSNKISSYIS